MNGERLQTECRSTVVRSTGGRFAPRISAMALALSVALGSIVVAALATTALAQSAQAQQQFSIPAGSLREALEALASQSGITVLYSPELVVGKATRELSGRFTSSDALRRLLQGSGLEAQDAGDSTFTLRQVPIPRMEPQAGTHKVPEAAQSTASEIHELEKMTVTGTRIRGVQPSSPVVMVSQEEMRLSGHNSLGEVIRALPQNFSGGQNPGVQLGAGAGGGANQNITGGSSLNLRGLGPDATLTLLNGARLPYDGFTQATDVAVIPVAAIERMEVLLDGASALYGSDAVGGVANIVLKRDYEGAEISARYGQATEGGNKQTQISAVAGTQWATGGFLVAGETSNNGAVRANQRDYLDYISNGDQLTIYPKLSQDGFLLSGYQLLGPRAELALDGFYTKRLMTSELLSAATLRSDTEANTSIFGISPSIKVTLPQDWTMRLRAFVGEDESKRWVESFLLPEGTQVSALRTMYRNKAEAVGIEFEGALFDQSWGARASFGAGWRSTEFAQINLVAGTTSTGGSNSTRNLHGEIYFPVIGSDQGVPLVREFSISAAARYEDHDSFGDTTTPKIGAVWKITPSLDARASWGKSFKAPRLSEQYQDRVVYLYPAATFGITGVPDAATLLMTSGGNPDLGPERAEVATAGLVFRPSLLPGATVDLGWFDIDYRQRVVAPFTSIAAIATGLNNPNYASFVVQNPTPSQQEEAIQKAAIFSNPFGVAYDPNAVIGIFNNHWFNASSQTVRGVDLDMRYSVSAFDGLVSFNAAGSWITDSRRELIDGAERIDTAGVAWFPPKFKGRLGANWSRSGFSLGAIVNHIDGVRNTAVASSPDGGSMTTFDLVLDFAADAHVFHGIGFNLSIMNAFNRRAPYLQPAAPFYVNYDSTNYSALGRIVSVGITKRF